MPIFHENAAKCCFFLKKMGILTYKTFGRTPGHSINKEKFMQKSKKAMLIGAIAAMVLAWPASAQSSQNSLGALTSDTRTATAGIFKTDVDNYMDVARYSTVEFDNWFGFISGDALEVGSDINGGEPENDISGKLIAGYARKLSESVYFGAFYQGNIVGVAGGTDTNSKTAEWDIITQGQESYTETTTYNAGWVNSNNHFEFLFGVGGHGFKVGFHESLYNNRHAGSPDRNPTMEDDLSGTVVYKDKVEEFSVNGGYVRPYIGWGTEFDLGDGKSLRPYANFGLGAVIHSQIDKYSNYSVVNGQRGNVETTLGYGYNNGYVNPYGDLGAKLDMKTKGGATATVELKWGISGNAWNNNAENIGLGNSAYKGTVGWADKGYVNRKTSFVDRTETETNVTLLIDERTDITNTITPAYVLTKEVVDGLKLGFSTSLPFTFRSYSNNQYTETHTRTITKYNPGFPGADTTQTGLTRNYTGGGSSDPVESSVFNMTLNLGIGASYKLIPGRFTINAGLLAAPANFTHKVETTKPRQYLETSRDRTVDALGNEIALTVTADPNPETTDSVAVTDTWFPYTGEFRGGFMFNFTPDVALDMSVNIPMKAEDNGFMLDLTTVHLLLSVKF